MSPIYLHWKCIQLGLLKSFFFGYQIQSNVTLKLQDLLRYEIRELRIMEAAIESTPQIMLQFYFLVKHGDQRGDPLV
jgi:hypothetical protein